MNAPSSPAMTHDEIVALLRQGPQTVAQLAGALTLTPNAVRAHLATLQRDGLVHRSGLRRSGRRPAVLYALTPEADRLLPRRYWLILRTVLTEVQRTRGAGEKVRLLRRVGARLAAGRALDVEGAPLAARVEAAAAALQELGGIAHVERRGARYVIQGDACPLSAIVSTHPEACKLGEALVQELVGVPVHEECDRGEHPRCRFVLTPAGAGVSRSRSPKAG